jgi:hypothetical protein
MGRKRQATASKPQRGPTRGWRPYPEPVDRFREPDHVARPMVPHMICVFQFQTAVGTVRRLQISVPLIECLVDGVRYFRPDDLPPASGEELRPILRPRITVRPASG